VALDDMKVVQESSPPAALVEDCVREADDGSVGFSNDGASALGRLSQSLAPDPLAI